MLLVCNIFLMHCPRLQGMLLLCFLLKGSSEQFTQTMGVVVIAGYKENLNKDLIFLTNFVDLYLLNFFLQ